MQRSALFLAAAALSSLASHTNALDTGLTVFEESEYTSNTARTKDNEISEWIHSPGVNLTANHQGPKLELDVDYTLIRRLYQEDLWEDNNESRGTVFLNWDTVPERLSFTVNHTRTQSAVRTTAATTPDNRQETTVTSAGPTVRFNPRGADEVLLQYFRGRRTAELTRNDADTDTFIGSYIWNASDTRSITLSATRNEVDYDEEFAPDIEYNTGELTWARNLKDLQLSIMGGYTDAKRSNDF